MLSGWVIFHSGIYPFQIKNVYLHDLFGGSCWCGCLGYYQICLRCLALILPSVLYPLNITRLSPCGQGLRHLCILAWYLHTKCLYLPFIFESVFILLISIILNSKPATKSKWSLGSHFRQTIIFRALYAVKCKYVNQRFAK